MDIVAGCGAGGLDGIFKLFDGRSIQELKIDGVGWNADQQVE